MTTPFDTEMSELAQELIDDFGTTYKFTVVDSPTYSTVTLAVTNSGETEESLKVSPILRASDKLVRAGLVRADDSKIIIATKSLTFTLKIDMKIEISGKKWTIIRIDTHESGDDTAAFTVHIRK